MDNRIKKLEGKKIGLLGFGVEGQSLANFLSQQKLQFSILDQKEIIKFSQKEQTLAKKLSPDLVFGKKYLKSLFRFDIIFRSPGVYRYLAEIVKAEKNGTKISSATQLFFDLSPAQMIGVTGTKGKGTTATLIYKIIKQKYSQTFLGGNIGDPPLTFLSKLTSKSWVVLELSSFQLIDLNTSPHIAVILMVTSEHLDWHKNVRDYLSAKESIVKYQKNNDFVIYNHDFDNSKRISQKSKAKKYSYSKLQKVLPGAYLKDNQFIVGLSHKTEKILGTNDLQLLGKHNWENVLASILVGFLLDIQKDKIRGAVKDFKGLPYRLEKIDEVNGVSFYNDSFSTTPETTIAAINSFRQNQILILGGSSKNSDFSNLALQICKIKNIKVIILIGQTANEIEQSIRKKCRFKGKIIRGLVNMQQIVRYAYQIAQTGDVVLLSPACASFDMFDDYKHRGDLFKKEVKNLSLRLSSKG